MTKHSKSIVTRGCVATLLGLSASLLAPTARSADTATASATAVVLTPIAVSKSADLVFGSVVAGNGDVTLSTSGARTKSGGTVLPTSGTTAAAGRFDVTGTGAATFSIDYSTSDSVLTSGSDTMAIDWITEVTATTTPTGKTATGSNPATGTLSSGAAYIYAGGKLTVGASQPAGTYTGNLIVIVAYN